MRLLVYVYYGIVVWCVDIDKCKDSGHNFDKTANCKNTAGSLRQLQLYTNLGLIAAHLIFLYFLLILAFCVYRPLINN